MSKNPMIPVISFPLFLEECIKNPSCQWQFSQHWIHCYSENSLIMTSFLHLESACVAAQRSCIHYSVWSSQTETCWPHSNIFLLQRSKVPLNIFPAVKYYYLQYLGKWVAFRKVYDHMLSLPVSTQIQRQQCYGNSQAASKTVHSLDTLQCRDT